MVMLGLTSYQKVNRLLQIGLHQLTAVITTLRLKSVQVKNIDNLAGAITALLTSALAFLVGNILKLDKLVCFI